MKNTILALALALALAGPVSAQTAAPTYLKGNQVTAAQATTILDQYGTPLFTTGNPGKVNCVAGCSGGGGSTGAVTQSTGGGSANTWTVGGVILTPTATFTTTSATSAWASNQLIANSATAGSVIPLAFANACRVAAGSASIRRAQIQVASDTGFAGQSLVLALYTVSPTFANGDRGTWLTNYSGFIGTIAVTLSQHFSDYEQGMGTPVNGSEINFTCAGGSTTIYGALISAGTLTPQAGSKAIIAGLENFAN